MPMFGACGGPRASCSSSAPSVPSSGWPSSTRVDPRLRHHRLGPARLVARLRRRAAASPPTPSGCRRCRASRNKLLVSAGGAALGATLMSVVTLGGRRPAAAAVRDLRRRGRAHPVVRALRDRSPRAAGSAPRHVIASSSWATATRATCSRTELAADAGTTGGRRRRVRHRVDDRRRPRPARSSQRHRGGAVLGRGAQPARVGAGVDRRPGGRAAPARCAHPHAHRLLRRVARQAADRRARARVDAVRHRRDPRSPLRAGEAARRRRVRARRARWRSRSPSRSSSSATWSPTAGRCSSARRASGATGASSRCGSSGRWKSGPRSDWTKAGDDRGHAVRSVPAAHPPRRAAPGAQHPAGRPQHRRAPPRAAALRGGAHRQDPVLRPAPRRCGRASPAGPR